MKYLWEWLQPWVFLGMTLHAWHNCILGVSPISLQILSSSIRLDGEHRCTAIFRCLQWCSGWATIQRLVHVATPALSWLCASGYCPVWRWTFTPVWWPGAGIHQGSLYFVHSSFPWSWLVSQSLPLKNITTAQCCRHHASPYGWCQVSSRRDAWHLGQSWFHNIMFT